MEVFGSLSGPADAVKVVIKTVKMKRVIMQDDWYNPVRAQIYKRAKRAKSCSILSE